ncbi:MAG: multidrug transporter [Thermodesulfobacteriota bacterium]
MKRMVLLLLTLSLVATSLCSTGWAGDNSLGRNDPIAHEWYMLDVLFARPIGIIAGIAGTAVFVVSLPFTIPTGGVRDAADIFIVKPFQFSFVRQFPDEDI